MDISDGIFFPGKKRSIVIKAGSVFRFELLVDSDKIAYF